jgi:hypothetical protein
MDTDADDNVDHLRALYQQTPATLTGNAIGLLLISIAFAPLAPGSVWLGWLAAGVLLWLLRLAHYLRYRTQHDADDKTLRGWRSSWRALVLAQGTLLASAVWLFWGLGSAYHLLSLLLIVYTYCLGSVQLLASQPRVFLGFIGIVLTPTIVRVASDASQPCCSASRC